MGLAALLGRSFVDRAAVNGSSSEHQSCTGIGEFGSPLWRRSAHYRKCVSILQKATSMHLPIPLRQLVSCSFLHLPLSSIDFCHCDACVGGRSRVSISLEPIARRRAQRRTP